jgi:hypothetical protein
MKKINFILFLTLFSFNSFGQVWIDSGAVWHYDYWNIGYWGFSKYEYVKDTLVQNHNCQMITGESYSFANNQYGDVVILSHDYYPNQFTYVSGDTVFYLNNGEFFILYNFGASIGDKWVLSTSNPGGLCDDTSRIIVTDTGKIIINSIAYRFITVQPTSNSPLGLKGMYIERFGNLDSGFAPFQYLFPGGFQCDSMVYCPEWNFNKFKCFEDSSFTLYNPSLQDCEYYLTYLGIPETNRHELICYPNPTSGILNIDNTFHGDQLVEIYNYQGCLLRKFKLNSNLNSIDISDLKNGIYFLKFQFKTDNFVYKIIKE